MLLGRMEYERLMRAKCLARTGWMQRGVPPALAETVASHSFEAAVLAYIIASRLQALRVDPYKASLAALLHDAAEVLVGDIPLWSSRRMSRAKERLEEEALGELGLWELRALGKGVLGLVVKAADLMATALQAKRYVATGYGEVEEIYRSSKQALCSMDEQLEGLEEVVEELLGEGC